MGMRAHARESGSAPRPGVGGFSAWLRGVDGVFGMALRRGGTRGRPGRGRINISPLLAAHAIPSIAQSIYLPLSSAPLPPPSPTTALPKSLPFQPHAMTTPPAPPTKAFKILPQPAWAAWEAAGTFAGAAIDLTDGYIHLSTAAQALPTYQKYFAGRATDPLVVAEVDLARVADPVRWEPSRDGALFPHVYGQIPRAAVARVFDRVDEALFHQLIAEASPQ